MRQCLGGEPRPRDKVRSIFIIRAPDLFIFTVSKQHASIIPKIWGNFFFSPLSLSLSLSLFLSLSYSLPLLSLMPLGQTLMSLAQGRHGSYYQGLGVGAEGW